MRIDKRTIRGLVRLLCIGLLLLTACRMMIFMEGNIVRKENLLLSA